MSACLLGAVISRFKLNKQLNKYKMITLESLTVKITYRVGCGGVEMPENVKEQLIEAQENGDEIEMGGISKYPEAYEWLTDNIKERDCMDWSAEIEDIE